MATAEHLVMKTSYGTRTTIDTTTKAMPVLKVYGWDICKESGKVRSLDAQVCAQVCVRVRRLPPTPHHPAPSAGGLHAQAD